MKLFRFFSGVLFLSVLALHPAGAAFLYPPNLESAQDQAAYAIDMIQQHPWIDNRTTGYALDPVVVIQSQQKAMTLLKQSEEFQELAAQRPDPKTLYVDVVQPELGKAKVLDPKVVEEWKTQLAKHVPELNAAGGDELLAQLRARVQASVNALVARNPRNLVVGLTHALPGPEKGAIFKAGSVREQYALLAASANLTTEALKRSFKAQAFGLQPAEVTRENLLDLVESALRREDELHIDLMLAFAVVHLSPDDRAALLQNPAQALAPLHGADFDYLEAPKDRQLAFQEQILGEERAPAKTDFIDKLAKAQFQPHYTEIEQTVEVVKKSYIVKETSPSFAQFRGQTAGCCSTMYAAQYALSPQEFVYFIYSPGDAVPLGYLGIASVLTDGKKTAYVHDFGGGAAMTQDDGNAIIHAYYKVLEQLGFERITFGVIHGNNGQLNQVLQAGIGRANGSVPHQYLDAKIRQLIASVPNNTGNYDAIANQGNQNGYVFTPLEPWLGKVRVEVAAQAPDEQLVAGKTRTPEEGFLLLVNLLYNDPTNARAALFATSPEITSVQKMVRLLKNTDKRSLAEYYGQLKALFEEHGVRFTTKFQRDNEALFWHGHLRAPDALNTADESLRTETVKSAIQLLKKEKDAETVAFVATHREFFEATERFQKYISGFSPLDVAAPQMMHQLLTAGVSLDGLAQYPEKIRGFSQQAYHGWIRVWAMAHLPKEEIEKLSVTDLNLVAGMMNQGGYATVSANHILDVFGANLDSVRAAFKDNTLNAQLAADFSGRLPETEISQLSDHTLTQIFLAAQGQQDARFVQNVMRVFEVISRHPERLADFRNSVYPFMKTWAISLLPPEDIAQISDADALVVASSLQNQPNSDLAAPALRILHILGQDGERVKRMLDGQHVVAQAWAASLLPPGEVAKLDHAKIWTIASAVQQNNCRAIRLMALEVLGRVNFANNPYEQYLRNLFSQQRNVEKDPELKYRLSLALHRLLKVEYHGVVEELRGGLHSPDLPHDLREQAASLLECNALLETGKPANP